MGREYNGHINKTVSGRMCQRWASQVPHQHNHQHEDFPERSMIYARSFCRNPDNKAEGPWCYTTEPVWEYCNISRCYGMFYCSHCVGSGLEKENIPQYM
jgi:hypothetical protein